MTKKAWTPIWLVCLISAALLGMTLLKWTPVFINWISFIILAILASIGQLYKSESPSSQLYRPALIFYFAGLLILPFPLFAVLILVSHLVEWIKEMLVKHYQFNSWYIQPFNISMHILVGYVIRAALQQVLTVFWGNIQFGGIWLLLLAAMVYAIMIHLLIGLACLLTKNDSFKVLGGFDLESLSIDFVLLCTGIVLYVLMELNLWLLLPILPPLLLICRSLAIPFLKQQANTDAKTNLWNFKYFFQALDTEIHRSKRFKRPLTVVVADLDLLRNINNAYGHLAGDAVLSGVSKLLKQDVRNYDIVARLGGEEFGIFFPETIPEDAYKRVEHIRRCVQQCEFICPVTQATIKATMSFGIAGWNEKLETSKELIHAADIALYEAKVKGRNRTKIFDENTVDKFGINNLSYKSL
jgi:diguanylate cyclase (GGDEF)-like protein